MTTLATAQLSGRSLIQDELFERLTARLAKNEGYDSSLALRIMDQALAFLGTCAVHHGKPLSPSKMVDPGWHVFVLHTRDYRDFCTRIAGRFIDHLPTDNGPASSGEPAVALHRTVTAMRQAGYTVDDDLWFAAGNVACTGCQNGCHDDPPPPPAS